ncbi:uncharacterized protein METZ01_LOCUS302675, partial [marine metagenome]
MSLNTLPMSARKNTEGPPNCQENAIPRAVLPDELVYSILYPAEPGSHQRYLCMMEVRLPLT